MSKYGVFPGPNTEKCGREKLRIWPLFTQCPNFDLRNFNEMLITNILEELLKNTKLALEKEEEEGDA